MIYEYTQYNIIALMQTAGTLERTQLMRFFSDEMIESRLGAVLDKLVLNNYLKYNPDTDTYTYHAAPDLKPDIIKRRIRAFWVLANWGSTSILQVYVLNYPFQFMVVTTDNTVFDIVVCNSVNEAQLARHVWNISAIKNVPDDVNHIAVVPTAEIGEKVRPYGFDSYCLINPFTKETSYVTLEQA